MDRDNQITETRVKTALSRLSDSLGSLEIALEGRLENDAHVKDSAKEVQRMGADRTRLAGSLDDAEARCHRLEEVNREVSNRLVNAMENIRKVLDQKK